MKVASIADVKARLSTYVHDAEASGPVVITRNGKAVAVLVAPEDEDDLERILLSRSHRLQAILEESRASLAKGEGLGHEEFWDESESTPDRGGTP
jgi:prevent-host-death family protein